MALETRLLGRTSLPVTVLGFGAMELRGRPRAPELTDEQAAALLNAVLDSGINFIDTSIDYGHSEELIGKHIAHRRDDYFLASKCGCMLEPPLDATPPYPHDFSPENVRAGVEQSLRRLRTDHLDLVQVHMSPSRSELESKGTLDALQALKAEGKVSHIGMSGTLPNITDHLAMGVFDAFQIPYSALQRDHEEVITRAAEQGAGTIIRGGAARGAPSEDKQWTAPIGVAEGAAEQLWQKAGLDELLDGMTRMAFTLRFTLSHPDLHTTIVGTSNPAHLASNVAEAAKGPLPADIYAEAKRRLSAAAKSA
jgi:aryl-alcohol dehydrogenase-like predicted oxidoreductase